VTYRLPLKETPCRWQLRLLLCVALLLAPGARAAVLHVGPERDITRISDAAKRAKDGDIVLIDAGEYRGDVAVWHQKELTIAGLGTGAVLIADSQHAQGKGIWVINTVNMTVRNIEFRGARVPDNNGAGIRLQTGTLTVERCRFIDNQNGILTNNHAEAALHIRDSLFRDAPREETGRLPHLLYVGRIAELSIERSRFHNGYRAHLIKSRAARSRIQHNLIMDGAGGEAAYELEFPNGGDVEVIGNVIAQSPTTSNPTVISYGAEGEVWPVNTFTLRDSTLINEGLRPAWFARVWHERISGVAVRTERNTVIGIGSLSLAVKGQHRGNTWQLRGAPALPTLEIVDIPTAADYGE
jgi:hypothetical protein